MALPLFYSDLYGHSLHPEARFPRERYWKVREAIALRSTWPRMDLREPRMANTAELLLAHSPRWVRAFIEGQVTEAEVRRIGFRPWTPFFVQRTLTITGATLEALACIGRGAPAAGNLAGGTHHGFADHGEGYCVFNDIAIAARLAQARWGMRRILVIDLDVHQGNGTAAIFADDPSVFTLSVHGARNYPFRKERSDLDLELPDGAGDRDLMDVLHRHLPGVLASFGPDLVIYQAGVDALAGDRLGRLAVTRGGLQQRNALVYDLCESFEVPVLITMGGGYGSPIEPSVDAHVDVYDEAARRWG